EESRNDHQVSLVLLDLTVSASGQYRCEVISEHPSFTTDSANATMIVLREPMVQPIIVGAREIYEPSEVIKVGCQPQRATIQGPQPVTSWLVEGHIVQSDWVSQYMDHNYPPVTGLSLQIPGRQ
ncbi:unnamed protein product, partial [Meganyctiphanes norvegica]